MAAVITVVVGAFLALVPREVRSDLVTSRRYSAAAPPIDRASRVTTQQRLLELAGCCRPVRARLISCTHETTRDGGRARLGRPDAPNPQFRAVELLPPAGQALPRSRRGCDSCCRLDTSPPTASGVSRLQILLRVALYGGGDGGRLRRIGGCIRLLSGLAVRRPAVVSATAGLNRLVGDGASVKIGNRIGSGWTDCRR